MKRTWPWRACALALLMAMLCAATAGCKPRLTLDQRSDEYLISAPTLKGTQHAQELNERLVSLYDPLLQTLSALRSEGLDVLLRCEILYTPQGTLLKTMLTGNGAASDTPSVAMMNTGTVDLPILTIDEGGDLYGTELWNDAMLRDTVFIKDLLLLSALHVDVSVEDYSSVATERSMASRAVALHEGLTGKAVDTTGILPAITDEISAKAYTVGLFIYYEDMPNLLNTILWPPYFFIVTEQYVNNLYATQYSDLGRVATVEDGLNYLNIMLSPTGLLGNADVVQRLSSWQTHRNETLTRAIWATLCRQCFESLDIEVQDDDYVAYSVQDSKLADVKYVLGYGLAEAYPGYNTFTPNQEIRLYQLCGLSSHFAAQSFALSLDEQAAADEQIFTLGQVSRYLGGLAAYCLDANGAQDQTVRVVNDRPYSFYARQADTGQYSEVNCMPTLVYMSLKWQNEAFEKTPAQIREEVDPKGKGGWTLWMAKEALEQYDGRYDEWYLSYDSTEQNVDKVMKEIDDGNVIFCMIHEGDLAYDGHCMLIYGYEKSGDSMFFYVQDPGLGTEIDAYGKPMGQERKLEAHYALWVTERWSFAVLSIKP